MYQSNQFIDDQRGFITTKIVTSQSVFNIRLPEYMGGSPGDVSEELVTQEKQKKGWRMNCDVDEATESLENEL